MAVFVKSEHFRRLNIGFSLDEGMASPNDDYVVFYGERSVWRKLFILFILTYFTVIILPIAIPTNK